jgi:Na+-translocating ferredoxin:NAD+ oxidoreductase RnfG subunit
MKIPRFPVLSGLLLAVLGAALPAHATDYWSNKGLLSDFFKTAKRVTYRQVTLSDAEASAIAKKLGADLRTKTWSVYFGEDDNKQRTGYAILDQEIGLHDLIDFGVRFGVGGKVERVEIMAYREPYGDQVRGESFRKQFVGKTAADRIVAGQDIDIVSGASISSKSVALGVKRDTLILSTALKNGSL